ncbi:LysR family transcriptional regulator [uncultured Roseobacter sp.]|uniref:LysR family transcriptional regulator n=1 Tax=uncultured Roseobacter sp. TaxID=114847 RepID=UPI00261A5189|nr:LysR family transcriptional regulator [uncultured Roseobacter sp.]
MNLRDLMYVIAVADHRNFTRAAEIVNVSQPALSNQIKKLEAELGLDIFKRGNRDVHLTEFGSEFLAAARQINGLVERIDDVAQQHRNVDTMPLRLGMTPTLAAYLSRYFRDMFAHLYPDMRVIIVEEYPAQLAHMVESKAIDVAFIARKSHTTLYEASKKPMDFASLWLEPLYLGVRKGHFLSKHSSIWAHEVPADLLVRFDTSFGYDLEKDLPQPSTDVTELVGIDVRTARFETVCRHVAESDACTMINAIAAMQFRSDNFGLDFIPFNDEGNIRELGAITRPEYPRTAVIDAMRSHIQEAPPPGTVASQPKEGALKAAIKLPL